METQGVLTIFRRSVEKLALRFNPFIGDGDSKSYTEVVMENIYGDEHPVKKSECTGHVQKRCGTGLRRKLEKSKGLKLSDGRPLGGKGRLTLARIMALQNFYGNAIKSNKGDPVAMAREIWAGLYHCADPPDHTWCPDGPHSWCRFKSDQSTGLSTYKLIENRLAPAIIEYVLPLYKRLTDHKLLEAVQNCDTQNPNESLHHVAWAVVGKDQYNSPQEVQLGVDMGILYYNNGRLYTNVAIMKALGLSVTDSAYKLFYHQDKSRIYAAAVSQSEMSKKRRKRKRAYKLKQISAFRTKEGVQYSSGKFTTQSTEPKPKRAPQKCRKCGQIRKGHKCTAV